MHDLYKSLSTIHRALCLALVTLGIAVFPCKGESQSLTLFPDSLHLTPGEMAWVKSHEKIIVAGPKAFPPFHYYDEQGKLKGIAADYLFTIMDRLGIRSTATGPIPWDQVLEKAKSDEIDLIPCIAISEDRKSYLDFSHPFLSFPLVIFSLKDAPFIGGIEDLHGRTLAVIEKNVTQTWLKRDSVDYIPYPVASPRQRLEAVSLGRAEAGIENLAAATYIIQRYGLTNIKIAAPTPYGNYNLYMAVGKNRPELLGIINKVMEQITPEQKITIRNKWLSLRYEHGLRPADIIKWILAVTAVCGAILAVILSANAKLKKEIGARKKAMAELEEAAAEIKTLEGIVPICSSCKKIRDDKGYWNRLEAYIEKHSQASFSHSMCPECTQKAYGKEDWYIKRRTAEKKGAGQ
ncbi:MAG: transporter substrate-binding domain-containing protein [Desulfobacter sp.]|nr:MAG: transporter substrate-binding domain-containing protein [Desulfobacter sp.]